MQNLRKGPVTLDHEDQHLLVHLALTGASILGGGDGGTRPPPIFRLGDEYLIVPPPIFSYVQ